MLEKTLSIVILILALLSGATIFTSAHDLQQPALAKERNVATERGIAERVLSFPSQTLSRLSMFPLFHRGPVPIAVMIENHEDARPHQEGMQNALMVQEFLVEGFISRFVVLLDSHNLPLTIGPVRSLRPYFLDAVLPWTRTVFHAGGSPEALDRVQNGSEFYARNLLYFDDESGSLRSRDVAPPHNLFMQKSFLEGLLAEVPESYTTTSDWPPYPVGTPEGGESAYAISINFFSSLHNVQYEYLPLAQKYQRTNGATVSKARPSTVVLLEVPINNIGEYGRLTMSLLGSGKAQVFHSGMVYEGRWIHESLKEPISIVDENGNDIPFARGQIWETILPTLERVQWE